MVAVVASPRGSANGDARGALADADAKHLEGDVRGAARDAASKAKGNVDAPRVGVVGVVVVVVMRIVGKVPRAPARVVARGVGGPRGGRRAGALGAEDVAAHARFEAKRAGPAGSGGGIAGRATCEIAHLCRPIPKTRRPARVRDRPRPRRPPS